MSIFVEPRIRQQGDRCLIIDLGDRIDDQVGLRCLALAQKIRELAIDGVLDIVPSFIAVAVYYEPTRNLGSDPAQSLQQLILQLLEQLGDETLNASETLQTRSVVIPLCYGGIHGPDLDELAQHMGLPPEDVIRAHHAQPLRVYMLGFAPGHPYIGIHDERFAIARRDIPRTAVPAGSLGIANRQSTIYPNRLPGGWHIIGATPLRLFNPASTSPTLLRPGDMVRFEPISVERFEQIRAEQDGLNES